MHFPENLGDFNENKTKKKREEEGIEEVEKKVEFLSLLLSWSLGKKKRRKGGFFLIFNTVNFSPNCLIFKKKILEKSGFFIFSSLFFSFLKKIQRHDSR